MRISMSRRHPLQILPGIDAAIVSLHQKTPIQTGYFFEDLIRRFSESSNKENISLREGHSDHRRIAATKIDPR
jgi:hypothetical protein